jgi:hypothetical protein
VATRQRTAAELVRASLQSPGRRKIGPPIVAAVLCCHTEGAEALKGSGEWLTVQDDVEEFVRPMLAKLGENMGKGNYRDLSLLELFDLLVDEVDELKSEIHSETPPPPSRIVHEAADVANFAMMIATVASGCWAPGWYLPEDG